jgi:hypothetical protein
MRVIHVTFCCILALAATSLAWASEPQDTAPTTETVQPTDQNGNPMTPQEFDQANKARMDARTKAVEDRLKARQDKWKKIQQKAGTNGTTQNGTAQ